MNIVGKLHIDGLFEGRIASLDTISVGKRGEVRGFIQAQEIHVSGRIDGEITCGELLIENGGEVKGVVFCDALVIARKGSFVGERHLKSELKTLDHKVADPEAQPPEESATLQEQPEPDEAKGGDVSDMLGQMLGDEKESESDGRRRSSRGGRNRSGSA